MEANRRVEDILKLLMYGTSSELSSSSALKGTALSPGGVQNENAEVRTEDENATKQILRQISEDRIQFPGEVEPCVSKIPISGIGVRCKTPINDGMWVGPYEGKVVSLEDIKKIKDTSLVWEVYDNSGEISHFVDGNDCSLANWMRYIRCARSEKEQNMAAFQHLGQIYFRACRTINPGEELLVWYGDEYKLYLGLPLLIDTSKGGCAFRSPNQAAPTVNDGVKSEVTVNKPQEQLSPQRDAFLHAPMGRNEGLDKSDATPDESWTTRLQLSPLTIKSILSGGTTGPSLLPLPLSNSLTLPPSLSLPTSLTFPSPSSVQRPRFSPFETTSLLSNALHSHSVLDMLLKCDVCGKSFKSAYELHLHSANHSAERPYECGHCGRTFPQSSSLRRHIVTHTGERPFKCAFCGRAFAGATTLNNHIRTHTGEKPHKCNACFKAFTQATQLNRHMRCCPVRVADKGITNKSSSASSGRSSAAFETLAEVPDTAVSMAMRDVLPATLADNCDLKVPLAI